MFYLIWQMGFLLLIAFVGGLFAGWQIWSSTARSAETDDALAEVARLRKENENLARRVGEAESDTAVSLEASASGPASDPSKGAEMRMAVEPVTTPKPNKSRPAATTRTATTKTATSTPPAVDYVDAGKPVLNDLLAIKGLGPKAAALLREGGVTRYAQIAAWSAEDVAKWDIKISGRGRITRDEWVEQAGKLG